MRQKLFKLLDVISEYHPDITPKKNDTTDDLLEKYFYWVTEYNDNYSYELEHPEESAFNSWICKNANKYMR